MGFAQKKGDISIMIRTRFAPSPTGYLHIGGLRTALFSYLWAKRNKGEFVLRIEDTDLSRNSDEAAQAIEQAFKWTGLSHDERIVYQSQRFELYKKYVQQLLDEDKAYYCYATKEELDAMREAQQAKKERPRYDGRFRDFDGIPPQGVDPVVRIKAPTEGVIEFTDGVKGELCFNVADMLDDFIIARSDGTPTYNFVVAVDDALMGIDDVIRGDDHLSNTPKQIVVYNALGFKIPNFYHVPMILNPQGKKLSKRDGAMDVMEYQKMGYLHEALLNFLVRLGWSHGDQEIFSMEEMLELFDPKDINKSASAYNQDKLDWLNAHYIKNVGNERLVEELHTLGLDIRGHDQKEILLDLVKERAKTVAELKEACENILDVPTGYDEKGLTKFFKEENRNYLTGYMEHLKSAGDLHLPSDFESNGKEYMEANSIKMKDLAQPIRLALTGTTVSPSVFDCVAVVGKEEMISRIEKMLGRV
jgi:glutamyl-tRNA synthetase